MDLVVSRVIRWGWAHLDPTQIRSFHAPWPLPVQGDPSGTLLKGSRGAFPAWHIAAQPAGSRSSSASFSDRQSGQRGRRRSPEQSAWKLWWCHNIELAISDLPPTQVCHTFNSNKEIDVKSVGLFILKVGQRLRVLKAHKTRHSINKNKLKNPQNIPVSTGVPSLCCTTHSHHHSYCSGYHFAWSHAHTFKDLSEQTWYPYNPIPFSARGWQKPCP